MSRLFSGVAPALFLSAVASISYGAAPYGVSPPSGKQWTMTFDGEFTQDTSINTNKWNGGAGGTDWCNLDFHGKTGGGYMFGETNDPCGQHYEGCTFSRTNGLEMRSPGSPSAALQTGGTTAQSAKFIQKFGYWEARFKVPHNTHGEGAGLHSDFWMHPIPEGLKSPTEWLPEINVGERPTWDANLDKANNQIYFGIHDYGPGGARKDNAYGGLHGTSPITDLSADWHTYGLYWRDDGSGPYGSMQFYLDGKPLWSPYTLSSSSTNMASGIYIFLLLDNDNKGADWANNPFCLQYVRVWRLDPSNRSSSSSSNSTAGDALVSGTPANADKALTEQEILAGANARIEQLRKSDAVVSVVARDGKPIPEAHVHVEQIRHAFLFGCNGFKLFEYNDPKMEAAFETQYTNLFNYTTLGFYWGFYEPQPGKTLVVHLEKQARWFEQHGFQIKGHPLVWHEAYPGWAPSDADESRKAEQKRVTEIVSHFAGLIDRWDVVNEATASGGWTNGVGHWIRRDGAATAVSEVLGWAHAANPKAFFLYNDYNLGADYEALARSLAESKQPPSAFGIQSHMHQNEWPIQRVWEVCETYARFGKPLHFTETTVLSGKHGWKLPSPWASTAEGEARQAKYVEKFYMVLFSNPAVQAITWWDFMDGEWMGAPAGLVRADLTPKPAYDQLMKLIKGKWWTRADVTSDAKGEASFRGFLGRYRITVETPHGKGTQEDDLKPDGKNTIKIKIEGQG